MFEFAWPWVFLLAPLPWLLRLVLPPADSGEAALKVSFLGELEGLSGRRARANLPAWRQQTPLVLLWLFLLLATARPEWVGEPLPLPASGRDLLLKYGQELMECAHLIDASVPQSLLLDLLNVNRADRIKVAPDDGITSIAFVNGLEDSAMYRGRGWKQGPLAQATIRFMNHELIHNQQLQRTANEHLFGKGGMFEFLPTYRETGGGMVRMPPKLRLADECDAKINAAG